jgi:hypothetical protein
LTIDGTGSCPPLWNGWQRSNRRSPSQAPRDNPNRSIASAVYALHDGVYRQHGGRIGPIAMR